MYAISAASAQDAVTPPAARPDRPEPERADRPQAIVKASREFQARLERLEAAMKSGHPQGEAAKGDRAAANEDQQRAPHEAELQMQRAKAMKGELEQQARSFEEQKT